MSERLSRERLEIIACCVESECDGDCPHAESERCLLQGDRDLLTAMRALLAHIAALEAEAEWLRYVEYEAMVMLDRMYPELYQTPQHLRPLRSALLRAERERERE